MSPIRRSTPGSRLIPVGSLDPVAFAAFGQVIQNPATHGQQPVLDSAVANQGTATKWLDVTHMTDHYQLSRSKKTARVAMNMFVCRPRKLGESDGKRVFPVEVLERHPFTPQTFIPLGLSVEDKKTYYLVVVASTLPARTWDESETRRPAYPTPESRPKRSLKQRLLGARPNPFTNDYSPSTTPTASKDSAEPKPKGPGPPDLANVRAFIARGDQSVTYGPGTWHAPMVVLGERPIEFVVVQYANGGASEDCQQVEVGADDGGEGLAVDLSGIDVQFGEAQKAKL